MAVETPEALVAALEAEIRSPGFPLSRQVDALSELHGLFTSRRALVKHLSYLDVPRLRSAYLRYHLPLNVARATCVLRQVMAVEPRLAELTEVVDLGAGPASAGLATLLALPDRPGRSFRLQDRSRAALQVGARLLARVASESRLTLGELSTRVESLPRLPALPRRSLVWLSMVLNEVGICSGRGLDPAELLSRLARNLESPSVVIILEPALRLPGRNLLHLHDAAAASPKWRVLAPCTHQFPCPLLRLRDRPWCHFHFSWRAPAMVRQVADPLGLDHERPSLAFLALERVGERSGSRSYRPSDGPAGTPECPHRSDPSEPAYRHDRSGDRDRPRARRPRAGAGTGGGGDGPERARVIGDPMRVRGGKVGVYVCREGERGLLVAPPAGVNRGDVLLVSARDVVERAVAWA